MNKIKNISLAAELINLFKKFPRKFHHRNKGLNMSNIFVLKYLGESEGEKVCASDLKKLMHITPAAITHILDNLETNNLIVRTPDPDDRRSVVVTLTPVAKDFSRKIDSHREKKIRGLVDFLGENDTLELIRIGKKAFKYFEQTDMDEIK